MGIGRCMADVLSAGLNANECREAYLRGINTRGWKSVFLLLHVRFALPSARLLKRSSLAWFVGELGT